MFMNVIYPKIMPENNIIGFTPSQSQNISSDNFMLLTLNLVIVLSDKLYVIVGV